MPSLVCNSLKTKYNQSGAISSPYLYYRESKPYAKDKVGMKAPLSFYALSSFTF